MKNKLKYLIKESLDKKIKTKWFKLANLIVFILIVGLVNIDKIINFFGGDFDSKTNIVVVSDEKIYDDFQNIFTSQSIVLSDSDNYTIAYKKDLDEEKEKLNDKEKTVIINIEQSNDEFLKSQIISYDDINNYTKELIILSLNQLKNEYVALYSGLNEEQIKAISNPINPSFVLTNPKKENQNNSDEIKTMVIMILILPSFFLITLLTQMIGSEINEEKSTKSMEIIISNVPPKIHFLAKIIASTLFVVLQGILIILYALLAIIIRSIITKATINIDSLQIKDLVSILIQSGLLNNLLTALPFIIILFLFSFLAYAIVCGVLASMTTSIEDFQQLQMPLMIILVFGYYLSMIAVGFEGSFFIKITAFIPLLSFLIAPTMFILNQMTLWELGLSSLIMVIFTMIIFKYGLRIYKEGILNYSSTKLWKKLFHSLKK